jgi:anaerobic ribonucleoside-triphosphate reductase
MSEAKFDISDHERTRCEVWTRVMGYFRPVSEWNKGKQSEHRDRTYYKEPIILETVS